MLLFICCDGEFIRFSYKDYAEGKKISYMTLKVDTFIGRLIRHIPDKHFAMIRWSVLFSNRWKKQYLALVGCALKQPSVIDSEKQSTPHWAER